MEKLKILLPKGRIYENVQGLFSDAGISIHLPERTYRPTVNQKDLSQSNEASKYWKIT
ncbi:MAG TPA: hypothetical protein VJ861_04730 [Treponemataceae bacterium]|nr:hypothetical protein [Treponemataceae bacterium]